MFDLDILPELIWSLTGLELAEVIVKINKYTNLMIFVVTIIYIQ